MTAPKSTVFGDVLNNWSDYELDDQIYLSGAVEPHLGSQVNVVPASAGMKRDVEGMQYLLGIEQVRDVVEGLDAQLGRSSTPIERLRAVVHYAQHDAFIDPRDAVGNK